MHRPSTGASTDANSIQVVARFRPLNRLEETQRSGLCVGFLDNETVEIRTNEDQSQNKFQFDKIFRPDSQQDDVYDVTGRQIVHDVFEGYNGTIFVYGQTGSGKTFTMMGPSTGSIQNYCDDPKYKGIIPRVVEQIFDNVERADPVIEFCIKVSYVEIYMERVRDLFDPSRTNLQLKEDFRSGRGVYVDGTTEAYVADAAEVFNMLRSGAANRVVASTRMNEESSRSHSIFCITVTQKNTVKMNTRVGKLFLVDLAGSEKVGKTKAEGIQLEEAKLINTSLSTLGKVIYSLTDRKSTHVPYRDSKLTRLLQDSLGGNSRTTLIVCGSPSKYNDQESLSTMRFGERAKKIRNKARVNLEESVEQLKLRLAAAEREIARLKLLKGEPLTEEEGGKADDAAWQVERGELMIEIDELQDEIVRLTEATRVWELQAEEAKRTLATYEATEGIWEEEYDKLFREHEDTKQRLEHELKANEERTVVANNIAFAYDEARRELGVTKQVHVAILKQAFVDQNNEIERLRKEVENLKRSRQQDPSADAATTLYLKAPNPQRINTPLPEGSSKELQEKLRQGVASVMEMELQLDEMRQVHRNAANSNKALKQKILLLEGTVEQQSYALQEVFTQNSTLRLEMELAEKKLAIRNDRIENLKAGLKEEKRHLKDVQEQFGAERDRFRADVARYREELNYWKEKRLSTEKSNQLRALRNTNVVKWVRGGQGHIPTLGRPNVEQPNPANAPNDGASGVLPPSPARHDQPPSPVASSPTPSSAQ